MPLQIIRQDITKMKVDAIVNTTNEEMIGYSGVDYAVHTAAGPELDVECERLAPLGLGQAKITAGYSLHCKYVIHTSGPIWQGGLLGESILLRSCYIESLKLAVEHKCRSVAFPLISAGVYGYPKDQVLKFAVQTITEFLFEHELNVYLCVFDKEAYSFSQQLFRDIQDFIDGTPNEGGVLSDRAPCEGLKEMKCMEVEVYASRAPFRNIKPAKPACNSAFGKSLEDYVKQMDRSFAEMLFDLIDERGVTDVECYKRANVDKRIFSKIRSNKDYKPSKQTAIAFAISLRLSLDDTQVLLATAGYTLSRSNVFDQIVRYFIQKGKYDIFEINEALFEFDQPLLGCGYRLEDCIKNYTDEDIPAPTFEKNSILYIYFGDVKCHKYKHTIIQATAIVSGRNGCDIELNVEYCKDCDKYLLRFQSYDEYRKRYGMIIGNFREVNENNNEQFEGNLDLALESPLKLSGYTVGQKEGLRQKDRHYILATIIHNGIMTKGNVIRYLNYFIKMQGAKTGNEIAVQKWRDDLMFVQEYDKSIQPKVYISRIKKY